MANNFVPNFGEGAEDFSSIAPATPKYNSLETALVTMEDTAEAGFDHELQFLRKVAGQKIRSPGKLLTKEEWKKSGYYHEGIKFSQIKNGDGVVGENVAKLIYERQAEKQARQEVLANGPQTWGNSFANMLGGTIGFFLDKGNLAATVATFGMGARGRLGEMVTGAASRSRFAGTAWKAAAVTAETAAAIGPESAAKFVADRYAGQDVTVGDAFTDYVMNVGFAVPLYLTGKAIAKGYKFGKKTINAYRGVSPEAHADAFTAALSQKTAGKVVDVELIIKNGIREARENRGVVSALAAEEITALTNSRAEASEAAILMERELLELEQQERIKRASQGLEIEPEASYTTEAQIRERLNRSLKKIPAERNASERFMLERYEKEFPDIYNSEVKFSEIERKAPWERLANERIDLKERAKAIENAKKPILKRGGLQDPVIAEKVAKLKEINQRLKAIATMLEDGEMISRLENVDLPPLTTDDLKQIDERMSSYKSNSSYNGEAVEAFQQKVKLVEAEKFESSIALADKELSALRELGKLPEESIRAIEEAELALRKQQAISQAFEDDLLINCLIGND